MGRWRSDAAGRPHRPDAAGPAWFYAAKSVSDAPVLRGLPGGRNSLTAGETTALDAQPHHPEPGQKRAGKSVATGGTNPHGRCRMSFPRYPEYKDSGVAWLGEVPGHWNICALKRVADLKSGESITAEDIEE